MSSLKFVQANNLYLAGSGVIIGATSISLTSLKDIYGNVLTIADFGDKGYVTLEPDTTNEESATFTGITANANGTYTLTGVKTTLAKDPYTETSGLLRQHSGGTIVCISDTVAFWNTFGNKSNTGTWTAVQTFATGATPIITDAPSSATQAANKGYIDGVAIAGAPDSSTILKGISKMSVAPASATSPIAVGDNDPRVPTQNENDALVGTSGTAVSTSNKLVDNADTSNTIVANKVARYNAGGTGITGLPPGVDVQTFTANGTWTKPTNAKLVYIEVVGGGGSGGGGSSGGATPRPGGSGGGGGSISIRNFNASDLSSTVTVTVGVATTGGAGGVSGNGSDGSAGNQSSFGAYVKAYGGGAGLKGSTGGTAFGTAVGGASGGGVGGIGAIGVSSATSLGGFPATVTGVDGAGGAGGGGTATSTGKGAEYGGSAGGAASGTSGAGGGSIYGGGGGGGGMCIQDSNSLGTAGAGGTSAGVGGGAAGSGGVGGAGSAGDSTKCGGGGGGGGANSGGAGYAGGAGGAPGGAGGGGGGSSTVGGAGGAGARGEVRVYTYF